MVPSLTVLNPNIHRRSPGIFSLGAKHFLKIIGVNYMNHCCAIDHELFENGAVFVESAISQLETFGKPFGFCIKIHYGFEASLGSWYLFERSHGIFFVF